MDRMYLTILWGLRLKCWNSFVIGTLDLKDIQKQPSRGVLRKRRSENMQQIYGIYTKYIQQIYTHAEVRFQQSCFATLFKSHFGMGILL